ncbi:MAG: helix-turn-helix domain-containing protein [Oscillospiraceae bacterium]|jgi:transcriptional regulator with XRE-family HTH domain|nr:helix-turn-helix domain-containing protein [Oscillospiraceae bacterium]
MDIGNIIKKLRRERGYTQDELAARLNVTPQAVSKWESGGGLPDISQIMPLANVFGVSTDVLFGADTDGDRRIAAARELARNVRTPRDLVALRDAWRDLARDMPSDYAVQLEYANAVQYGTVTLEKSVEATRESEKICERILDLCTDTEVRVGASAMLCSICIMRGETDRAAAIAEHLPSALQSREYMLMYVAAYTRSLNPILRDNITVFSSLLQNAVEQLIASEEHNGVGDRDEHIELFRRVLPLIELSMWGDEHAERLRTFKAHYYRELAFKLAARGDREALEYAEKSADIVLAQFAQSEKDDGAVTSEEAGVMAIRSFLTQPAFDAFRDDPRFIALIDRINTSGAYIED